MPPVLFEPNGRLLLILIDSATEWPLDPATLQRAACRIAGRDLTHQEWSQLLLPTRPCRRVY